MKTRETFVATVVLAIGMLAMAGLIGSGAYAQAAGAEARGVHALSTVVAQAVCTEPATLVAAAPEAAQ
ncbi:hypothetical protein [Massilia sp. SYSU DXS3249]